MIYLAQCFFSYLCLFVQLSCSLQHLCPFHLATLLQAPWTGHRQAPDVGSLLPSLPLCQGTGTPAYLYQNHLPWQCRPVPGVTDKLRDVPEAAQTLHEAGHCRHCGGGGEGRVGQAWGAAEADLGFDPSDVLSVSAKGEIPSPLSPLSPVQ